MNARQQEANERAVADGRDRALAKLKELRLVGRLFNQAIYVADIVDEEAVATMSGEHIDENETKLSGTTGSTIAATTSSVTRWRHRRPRRRCRARCTR